MKSCSIVLLLLVISGCAKKEGANEAISVSDSLQTDSTPIPPEASRESIAEPFSYDESANSSDEYPSDEPPVADSVEFFSIRITLQRFAGGEEEEMITARLEELLQEYSKLKLDPVKRSYKRQFSEQYEDEGGQPYTQEINERKSEVWWYDSSGHLSVYTSVYREDDDMNGFREDTQLYLFNADSIVAGFEDGSEASQIAFTTRLRTVTKKCPYCGVQIMNDMGSLNYQVQPLRKDDVAYIKSELDKSWDQAKQELLQGFPTAKMPSSGILKYTVTAKDQHPYKAKLEIRKTLYEKLFTGI